MKTKTIKKIKSGRKPIAASERVVQKYYFVQQKHIDKIGDDVAKDIARNAVIKEAEKK